MITSHHHDSNISDLPYRYLYVDIIPQSECYFNKLKRHGNDMWYG